MPEELKRDLRSRHIQLLAVGGTVGTGLFLGIHKIITVAGPSVLLAYIIAGVICYFSMRSLGEMLLSSTKFRSFREVISAYLGEGAGFIIGCLYWMIWVAACILDSLAVGVYLNKYVPDKPIWLIPILVTTLIFILNIFSVKFFGEAEFTLVLVKMTAVCAVVIIGLYLIFSNQGYNFTFLDNQNMQQNLQLSAQFSNLWNFGGFFPKGIIGFLLGFQMAFLAFSGIESISVTAAETNNPEVTLPRAFKNLPVLIGLLYTGAVFTILCCVPWDKILFLQGSPFASIFGAVGLPQVEIIMTIILVTAATSGANSGMYISTRMLYGLAADGKIPKTFSKISKYKVPLIGLIFTGALVFPAVVISTFIFPDLMVAFAVFASFCTVSILFTWIVILFTYLIYRKKFKSLHMRSKFPSPAGQITSVICLLFFIAVFLMMFLDHDMRIGLFMNFGCLAIAFVLYFARRKAI